MNSPVSIVILGSLLLSGCATAPTAPELAAAAQLHAPIATADGLIEYTIQDPGVMFVRPGQMIGSYDAFFIDEVGIHYKKNQTPLDLDTENQLIEYFRAALETAIEQGGLPIVDHAGPCVLRLGFSIRELELTELRSASGAATSFVSSLGSMTLMTEFRDSQTGSALVRYGNRHDIEGGMYDPGSRGFRWRRLRDTFDDLMVELNLTLANNVPRLADTGLREECRGAIHEYGNTIRAASRDVR